nr:hypothetical protein [Tanacetum cinerariifolium]
MIPNQTKPSIKEPKHSFRMGYEHLNTTLVTKEVAESSTKNLVPILRECEVTSDNGSESIEPVKDDFPIFTTFPNLLFKDKDDVAVHIKDVQIEESKIHSNPLFDNDKINFNELDVENDDSDGEVDANLRVDNSISNPEHEFSESEESDFDNPSVPLPPPEPPDEEFDFKIDFRDGISVGRNTIVEFKCIDARVMFDDLSYFMFAKVFSFLSAESEDTIFDPGISD